MSIRTEALLERMQDIVSAEELRYHDFFWKMIYAVYYDRVVDEILAALPGPVRSVADCGAGYGYWSTFFAEKGLRVAAVELQASCLSALRATARAVPSIEPVGRDLHDLTELGNDAYDVAFSFATLHVARDPERALREMVAVTRPGGSIVIGLSNVEHPVNQAFWKDATTVNHEVTPDFVDRTLAPSCSPLLRYDSYPTDNRVLVAYGKKPLLTLSVHQKR